jgi:hypothetical protein
MGGRPIGRTPDSGSGYPGSSPGLPANLFNGLAKALTTSEGEPTNTWVPVARRVMIYSGGKLAICGESRSL